MLVFRVRVGLGLGVGLGVGVVLGLVLGLGLGHIPVAGGRLLRVGLGCLRVLG